MKFEFIDALGQIVEIDVVRKFYNSEGTIESLNLIEILRYKAQPIPYHEVASLALELYVSAKIKQSEAIRSEWGDLYENERLTSYSIDLAAYYQLINQLGLPEKNIKKNPEGRIKTLLAGLNIKCEKLTPMIYGYNLDLSINNPSFNFRRDSKALPTLQKLFSILLKYGLVVTMSEEIFSSNYTISIMGNSTFFGKDEIMIDSQDKFPPIEKREFKQKEIEKNAPLSLLPRFPFEEKQGAKDNFLINVFKQAFSTSESLKTLFNHVHIHDSIMEMDIEFVKGDAPLTQIQQKEILSTLQKLGINSKSISFKTPYKDKFICTGSRISIFLKKEEVEKIVQRNMSKVSSVQSMIKDITPSPSFSTAPTNFFSHHSLSSDEPPSSIPSSSTPLSSSISSTLSTSTITNSKQNFQNNDQEEDSRDGCIIG